MSTVFYNPHEANVQLIGVPARIDSKKAGRNLDQCFCSPLLSSPSIKEGNLPLVLSEACEDELISAAQMGDQQAFMELCGRHSRVTKRKIFGIVRNHEDTEDALQDTLLRAFTHLMSFRRSCKFATWLMAIGVNSALMIVRKRRTRKETSASAIGPDGESVALLEPLDRSPGPEAVYFKQQAVVIVSRELKKLRPSLRFIVDHYYGRECSLEEVAKEYEISLGAAKSRLLRGRERLRSSLAKQGLSNLDS